MSSSALFATYNSHNIKDPYQTNLEFLLQTLDKAEQILGDDTDYGNGLGGLPFQVANTITTTTTRHGTDQWPQKESPSKQ
jgi:hypothetical protein